MSSRELFKAYRQARSDPKTNYDLDKQNNAKAIDKVFNNKLSGTSFEATILFIKKRAVITEKAGVVYKKQVYDGTKANYFEAFVRPKWMNNVPAPWTFDDMDVLDDGTIIWGDASFESVSAHKLAESIIPAGNVDTVHLKVGDVVECVFGDTQDDILFFLNSVGKDKQLLLAAKAENPRAKFLGNPTKKIKKRKSGDPKDLSQYNVKGSNTISITGDYDDPSTIVWKGYVVSGNIIKDVEARPLRYKYIGVDPSLKGKFAYNGMFPDEFLSAHTFTAAKWTGEGANRKAEARSPQTRKILKDALPSLQAMNKAFKEDPDGGAGYDLPLGDVNRPYWEQVKLKSNLHKGYTYTDEEGKILEDATSGANKYNNGGLKAARPGRSKHGIACAIDFRVGDKSYQQNGKRSYKSTVHLWLLKHGYKYGWINPDWAREAYVTYKDKKTGKKVTKLRNWSEPWHFEWVHVNTALSQGSQKTEDNHKDFSVPHKQSNPTAATFKEMGGRSNWATFRDNPYKPSQ